MAVVLLLSLAVGALVTVLALPGASTGTDPLSEATWRGANRGEQPRWTAQLLQLLRVEPSTDSTLARDLVLVGSAMTLSDLIVYKAVAVGVGVLFALFIFFGGDAVLGSLVAGMALLAWGLPDARIRGQAKRTRAEIERRLPAFLQALAMMLEAGLNLQPALVAYVERDPSSLGHELGFTVAEIERGRPLSDAMLQLATRCQVDSLYRALAALVQANERGASGLADTCRDQAAEAWGRRRDKAREIGKQASTKMLGPIMLLILPVLLLFMLGPAFMGMSSSF